MKVAVQSLLVALAGTAVAQFGGWKEGQVNTSICTWEQLRGLSSIPVLGCLITSMHTWMIYADFHPCHHDMGAPFLNTWLTDRRCLGPRHDLS